MSKLTDGLLIGGGIAAAGLLGYLIYERFIKPSPMEQYLSQEYSKASYDLDRLLEQIKKGIPVTDKQVEEEWAYYKPSLDAMNTELRFEGLAPISLPDDFDTLSNEEKATTLKIYYMQANRRKAMNIDPTGRLFNTFTQILYGLGTCASVALFIRLVDIPGLIRKLKPPESPKKRTKIMNIKRSDGGFVKDAKVFIDDTMYVVSDGVLSVDLIVGQKYLIRIVKEGFEVLRKTIKIPKGTGPITNDFYLEPLAHPDAKPEEKPLPDMEPEEVVDLTPAAILATIAAWIGTTFEWMKNHPLETAAIIGFTIALVLTILTPWPGDEYATAMVFSSYLASIGIIISADDLLGKIPLKDLREWIGV